MNTIQKTLYLVLALIVMPLIGACSVSGGEDLSASAVQFASAADPSQAPKSFMMNGDDLPFTTTASEIPYVLDAPEEVDYSRGYIVEFTEEPLATSGVPFKNARSYEQSLKSTHNQFLQSIGKSSKQEFTKVFNGVSVDLEEIELEGVLNNPDVKDVYPNKVVFASLMESIPLIKANEVWKLDVNGVPVTGTGVTIAIIDTGVDYTHPDMGGCLGNGCKVAGGYDIINDDADPMDDHGHGTHVAGIAAGKGNGPFQYYPKGVAPDATVYAYKVLDAGGSGTFETVMAGLERAADPNNDGNFDDHVTIANLSLGGGGDPSDPVSRTVDKLVSIGTIVVVSAGNSGDSPETIGSPGTARSAITVGATDDNDSLAYFSSRGPVIWKGGSIIKPDVVAPGVDICSSQWEDAWSYAECIDDEHTEISGTSMSAPHVAGLAALLKQLHPDWTPQQIKLAIRQTAVPLGVPEEYGWGRIDALAAAKSFEPCIARIDTSGTHSGTVNISGEAQCDNFSSYTLSYKKNWNDAWTVLHSSESPQTSILATIDTTLLPEGRKYLQLHVQGVQRDVYGEDIVLFTVDNFRITEAGTLNYLSGVETIYGSSDISYKKYRLGILNENGTEKIICSGRRINLDGLLCTFDTTNLKDGPYDLRFSLLQDGVWLQDEPYMVGIIGGLLDNWPVENIGFPAFSMNTAKNDKNEQILIEPGYGDCHGNSCDTTSFGMREYTADASQVMYDQVRYDGGSTPLYSLYASPSVAHADKDYLVLANRLFPFIVGYNAVAMDLKANAFNGSEPWPYGSGSSSFGKASYTMIAEHEEEPVVVIPQLTDEGVGVSVFTLEGNTLEGFPVQIEREREYSVLWSGADLLQHKDGDRFGIAYGFFNQVGSGWELVVYYDIYDMRGNRIAHTKLFDDPSFGVACGGCRIYRATADFDNDGQSEVVTALSFTNINIDVYDPVRYQIFTHILDDDGSFLPWNNYTAEGYYLKDVALMKGANEPTIVLSRASTFSTLQERPKIIGLTSEGVQFETAFGDSNSRATSLVIGDVDGDYKEDIIVPYNEAYWKDDQHVIIIENGVIKRDITIALLNDSEYNPRPLLMNIDGKPGTELILQSTSRRKSDYFTRVFAINLGDQNGQISWQRLKADPQQTSCLDCRSKLVQE